MLGIPLALGTDAEAALNFFAPATGLLTDETIDEASVFGDMAGQALRLALQLAAAHLLVADLKAAMEHRTAIDLASGMIMEQSHCTQEEAFDFISKASRHRNQKLHDVADGIINARTRNRRPTASTFFED